MFEMLDARGGSRLEVTGLGGDEEEEEGGGGVNRIRKTRTQLLSVGNYFLIDFKMILDLKIC